METFIPKWIKKWQKKLQLSNYQIEHEIVDPPTEENLYNISSDEIACCFTDNEDLKIRIQFNVHEVPTLSESTVLHELLHSILSEMRDFITRHIKDENLIREFWSLEEKVVCRLVKSFYKEKK